MIPKASIGESLRSHPSGLRVPGRWSRPILAAVLGSVLVGGLGATLGGCNILTPVAYLLGGPGEVEPVYIMEQRPTVVFVDDRANVIDTNARTLRLLIADEVTERLMVKKVMPSELMINPRDAMGAVMSNDRASNLMAMGEIGRAVGAEVIIYLEMLVFTTSPDGVTPRPTAGAQYRILDVTNRVRLFPPPDGGEVARRINAVLPQMDPGSFRTLAGRTQVYEMLAMQLSDTLAKNFYAYEGGDIGGRIDPLNQ